MLKEEPIILKNLNIDYEDAHLQWIYPKSIIINSESYNKIDEDQHQNRVVQPLSEFKGIHHQIK